MHFPSFSRCGALCGFAFAAIAWAGAAPQSGYPEYVPAGTLEAGELRSMGSPTMDELTVAWLQIFRAGNPEMEDATMEARGNETVLTGLLTGKSQIGPSSRALFPAEIAAFYKKFGHAPRALRVCSGAFDKVGYSPALFIFVNTDNPITHLSLDQLREIFADGGSITRWGQLGLTGEWAERPIHLFGLKQPNGISEFLREAAMNYRPFRPGITARGRVGAVHALNAMVMDVARDPAALTYAAGGNLQPGTKFIPISVNGQAEPVTPTPATVADHSYPLSRYLYAYINQTPGKALDPNLVELLKIIFSRQGQEAVPRHSFFLPLTPDTARAEWNRLSSAGEVEVDPRAVDLLNLTVQGGTPEQFRETMHAQIEPTMARYVPVPGLSGELSSIGTDTLDDLMKFWRAGFAQRQPHVKLQIESKGSMTGEPALRAGQSQLAPESRELFGYEIERFKQAHGYAPLAVKVALGSYRAPERSGTVAILVNRSNPINRLTLAQLAAIFTTPASGTSRAVYTRWGELGLTGEWANRPIHLVGVVPADGNAEFLRHFAFGDGVYKPDIRGESIGSPVKVWVRMMRDIGLDPGAIGYGNFLYESADTKRIALSSDAAGPYLAGTFAEVASARYPLTRFVYIYLDRRPGTPLSPLVAEFMQYVLSADGQREVLKDSGFLPLPDRLVREELRKLQ
jgi:phosphate transport system substrate-binding protein